ncbi:GDSL-type esterase/lipase family protein [Planococcus shenhongbingii]|uniref:SGNH/GDSL hydrolase family protein n=1 Tax=Planococcus shenhongbingii TaxID=3058398 RepID=UPI00260CFB28|nr:GDSL-type esterase/lipase family protein [Planococcus sp. N016]WKA57793.1 GDSL-type esterase/lipase family protein [Planococcus sp. N016]
MYQKLIIGVLLIAVVFIIYYGERNFGKYEASSSAIKETQETQEATEVTEETREPVTFSEKLEAGEAVTVVFLGDSVTEQNKTTNSQPNHVGKMQEWFDENYPDQVQVINAGVSGNSITQMKDRLSTDVLAFNPDLVIVSAGLNDAVGTSKIPVEEFKESYAFLVNELQKSGETEVIVRTPNLTLNPSLNNQMVPYLEATKTLAQEENVKLFDFYETMASDMAEKNIKHIELMQDIIHPDEDGQEYIFQTLKAYMEKEVMEK